MTECERIIKEGILPETFFKPETICDFYVDETRKKIWAIELDLLLQFDNICQKYGLKYFLIGGSLLGAIRHNGFIPWDDDIDVGMPRSDYDIFVSLCHEFKEPYFLQTPHTDPEYAYSYAKLRNSNTTYVSKMFMYQNFNHGIYLDIFPFEDWIDNGGGEERFNRIHQLSLENSTYMRLKNPHLDKANQERVQHWCGRNPIDVYDEIQRLASEYKGMSTEKVCKVVFTFFYGQELYPREYFDEIVRVNFEGFNIPIPINYDKILTQFYGDYMSLPPAEKRDGGHGGAIFNADIPYKVFLDRI